MEDVELSGPPPRELFAPPPHIPFPFCFLVSDSLRSGLSLVSYGLSDGSKIWALLYSLDLMGPRFLSAFHSLGDWVF
jgi:hypothetical protein